MESISVIHFLIRSVTLCPFPFAFVSLCDLTIHDSVSVMSVCSPIPIRFHLDTWPVCLTLAFPTRIYKSHMSCMFPQFVYQLRPDFYCHSPFTCDLSLPPRSTSVSRNCLTLATSLFIFTRLWKPSCLILRPCSFPATCRTRIYLPIFEIPGLRQKAGAVHELKPLSIPPIAPGNLRDPVFAPGSLGLTRNNAGGRKKK